MDQGAPGPTVGAKTAGLTLCGPTAIGGPNLKRVDPSIIRRRHQVADAVATALGRLGHPFWIARLNRRVAGADDRRFPLAEAWPRRWLSLARISFVRLASVADCDDADRLGISPFVDDAVDADPV